MNKSPSINFDKVRKKIVGNENNNKYLIKILIVIIYSFLNLLLLLKYKPSFIRRDRSYLPKEEDKISYVKLGMFYILFEIPLFLYLFLS